jgi:hypothetical protein
VFTVSRRFLVLDYLRVPYDVDQGLAAQVSGSDGVEWARLTRSSGNRAASLVWPVPSAEHQEPAPTVTRFCLGDLILHAALVPDETVAAVLTAGDRVWSRTEPLLAQDGRKLGSVWRSADGSIALPFDPDEVVTRFWSESYEDTRASDVRRRARSAVLKAYYAVRPVVPRSLQIAMRRAASRLQRRRSYPRWPVEESLHGFFDLLLDWVGFVASAPVPWIAPWPAGWSWALVLTHDVETELGLRRIPLLKEVDERAGSPSSWNLVPGRYRVDDALVAGLHRDGFEVGVHGLLHDGRDLDPAELPQRLPQMRQWAERWGAVGFRSPATRRDSSTMAMLPFQYDSSFPDTDPFEPQSGGCCSWLPFFNGGIVELPITMPQDHTLFVILRARDARLWIDKAERIRARGGMVLLITHPDYVMEGPALPAYEQLLAHFAEDPDVWRATPAEVAAWWRRRNASSLHWTGSSWEVVGPAAGEAAVSLSGRDDGRTPQPVQLQAGPGRLVAALDLEAPGTGERDVG